MGMRVGLHIADPDARSWPLNQLNAMLGNWLFAALVCLLLLFLPDVRFLTLAGALFAFLKVLLHAGIFNLALKNGTTRARRRLYWVCCRSPRGTSPA